MLGHVGDQATRGTALWRPLAETTIKEKLPRRCGTIPSADVDLAETRARAREAREIQRGASTT
jgi:hypothetical protein